MWSWRNMFRPNWPLTELTKVWHVTTENAYQSGPIQPLRMEMTRNTSALSGHTGTEAPHTFFQCLPYVQSLTVEPAGAESQTYFAKAAAQLWHFKAWCFFLQRPQHSPLHSCPVIKAHARERCKSQQNRSRWVRKSNEVLWWTTLNQTRHGETWNGIKHRAKDWPGIIRNEWDLKPGTCQPHFWPHDSLWPSSERLKMTLDQYCAQSHF